MRFSGKVYKDGKFWLAEIPILDAITQGHTRKEALEMVADMLEIMVKKEGFQTQFFKRSNDKFEVGSTDSRSMVSFLLQRKRELSGLSLSQVAERLGASSRNAYARYEQGRSVPTIEKLHELLGVVCPNTEIVIEESDNLKESIFIQTFPQALQQILWFVKCFQQKYLKDLDHSDFSIGRVESPPSHFR